MSTARQRLYDSLQTFAHALDSLDITSKDPILEKRHNERARLLRNGLAVSGFAMVEEFIKERTGKILERIGDGLTPFGELPEGLKTAAIIGVIDAMQFQAKFLEKTVVSSFYQEQSQLIATTLSQPYKISKIALGNNYTNLSTKEIEEILDAFRIETPWSTLSGIVKKLGLGILAPKQSFENAVKRRHQAAHQISTSTEYSDLKAYQNEAVAICLSFDLLTSKALSLLRVKNKEYLKNKKLTGSQIQIRYLTPKNDLWREIKEGGTKAVKTSLNFESIKHDCLLRGKKQGFCVIHTTESGIPLTWFTPEIDF